MEGKEEESYKAGRKEEEKGKRNEVQQAERGKGKVRVRRKRGRTNLGRAWWYDCSLQSTCTTQTNFLRELVSLAPWEESAPPSARRSNHGPGSKRAVFRSHLLPSALTHPPECPLLAGNSVVLLGEVNQILTLCQWTWAPPQVMAALLCIYPQSKFKTPKEDCLAAKYLHAPQPSQGVRHLVWSIQRIRQEPAVWALYRYIPLSFPKTLPNQIFQISCLISSNPTSLWIFLLCLTLCLHTAWVTKGTPVTLPSTPALTTPSFQASYPERDCWELRFSHH